MRQLFFVFAALPTACTRVDPTGPSSSAVAWVRIHPPYPELIVGETLRLTVTLYDVSGTVLTNRTISLVSSNESVVSVNSLRAGPGAGRGCCDRNRNE